MSDDENAEENEVPPRGRPFEKGESGNPAGRPKGSRNRTSLIREALIDGAVERLLQKALEKAEGGDSRMLELFLKPILRQERPVTFELPEKLRTATDAAKVTRSVLKEVARGEMTIAQAERIMALIPIHLQAIETVEFEEQLKMLGRCFMDQWVSNS